MSTANSSNTGSQPLALQLRLDRSDKNTWPLYYRGNNTVHSIISFASDVTRLHNHKGELLAFVDFAQTPPTVQIENYIPRALTLWFPPPTLASRYVKFSNPMFLHLTGD